MRNARILIVEDEPVTALDEKEILEEAGYQVIGIVDTGIEAINFVRDNKPDIILMDITLKGDIDGVEVAREIKKNYDIPVIFVTANKNESVFRDAKETVPFAYITKPISMENLKFSVDVSIYKNNIDSRLRESEEQYRNLVETTPHGIYEIDISGGTVFANNAMHKMFGYSAKEMKEKNISDLLHGKDRSRIISDIAANVEKQSKPFPYICKCTTKSGGILDVEINWNYKRNAQGKITGIISIVTDLTEEKLLRDQLNESKIGKNAALDALDNIPFGIVLVDENCRVKFINMIAREIVDKKDCISIRKDIISPTNSRLRASLTGLVRKIIDGARNNRALPREVMSLPRSHHDHPYSVMICPLWGNHLQFGLGKLSEPLAVLFIADPYRSRESAPEILQKLFGLTLSEAKLAERLVSDLTIEEAAQDMGIAISTARSYIKKIFSKTGTNRQSQLVKLILSTPL